MADEKNAPPPSSIESTALIETVEKIKSIEAEAEKEGVGYLDILSEKLISRKLLVWIISTIFLHFDKITQNEWFIITSFYLGVQGVSDLATNLKKDK